MENSPQLKLCFSDLVVSIMKREIIHHVSGVAESGELLAVMGPTGSGKTTLLDAIAGYLPLKSGYITLNGNQFTNVMRRRLAYVHQSDIFLPNLTLWETLYFTAMTQIPESVSKKQKISRIEEAVKILDIKNCCDTIMGNKFRRGLSGGEKKRANIACAFLSDPDIILLDEPTTGLDSSNTHDLMQHLQNYASKCNKTIIVTIHQPSSQIFHMFSSLLLLADGQDVYFGDAHRAVDYFTSLNFQCKDYYNPADFVLDIIADGSMTTDASLCTEDTMGNTDKCLESSRANRTYNRRYQEVVQMPDSTVDQQTFHKLVSLELTDGLNGPISEISCPRIESYSPQTKWPTSFWTQYIMLTWRNFKQAKSRIFDRYDVIRAIFVGVLGGLSYFQKEATLDTFHDRMGLVFFCTVLWCMNVSKTALLALSDERAVITKERKTRSYRLSAYYFSKISSEIPMILVLPVIFVSFVYWMSSLGGLSGFFVFVGITILNCLVAQSIGHLAGAAITRLDTASLTSDSFLIFSLLFGGFYNTHLPWWLRWGKYLSVIHYPFAAIVSIILGDIPPTRCTVVTMTHFPQCEMNRNTTLTSEDVLQNVGIDIPAYCYVASLPIMIVVLKVLAFCVLRWKKP